jgi:hypothetical protein
VRLLPTRRDAPYLLLVLVILLTMLPFPLTDDTGHWQSMAYDLIHYGRWPYVGTWDQTFPGAILPHLAAITIFGPSDFGFRLFDLVVQMISVWMLFRFWRIWMDERMAWLTVLMYAFFYVRSAPFVGGMRDVYASLLVIAAAFPFVRQRASPISEIMGDLRMREIIQSGLIAGIAVTMRPTYWAYLVLLAALTPLRQTPRRAMLLLAAGLVPLALSFAIYACWPDALREYWTSTVLFNLDTYAHITRPFSSLFRALVSPKLLTIPAAFGLFLFVARWRKRRAFSVLQLYVASLMVSLAIVLVQRKYYLYHFAMFSILLTPLAATGIERLLQYLPRRAQMPAFIVIFWLCALPYEAFYKHFRHTPEGESFINGVIASYAGAVWPDTADVPVIAYVRAHSSEHDRVEICSFDPRLRLHMMREPVGPYASLHAIGFRRAPTLKQSDPNAFTSYQQRWRRAYLDSLAQVKPRFIVICRGSSAEYLRDPYTSILHDLPGFDRLISASYRLDTVIGQDEIYRRRDE